MPLQPEFEPLSDDTGLDVVDPVETRYFSLYTDEPVEPARADPDVFPFPVGTACRVSTARVRLPHVVPVDVRRPDGDHLATIDTETCHELPADDHLLELHSPIKIYLRVPGGGRIDVAADETAFEFDGDRDVIVGARSYHRAPAATITVPDDPEAVMEAISTFPTALKTTSPERAWPTLRGHPPRLERGDVLSIPDGLDPPETGIRIAIPTEYWAAYTVAPLSYYLGAKIVPGERAMVTTDDGVERVLGDGPSAVAEATESLLKRVFFLDCVTRTEGLYPDAMHERAILESRVDLDFANLYEASPADRLATYLTVPDDVIAAIESEWHRVTHVQPTPDAVELLPYVVNDLSLVRPRTASDDGRGDAAAQDPGPRPDGREDLDDELDAFLRRPGVSEDAAIDGEFVRSADARTLWRNRRSSDDHHEGEDSSATGGVPELDEYVPLPDVDALEQAWIGNGTPVRGTKLLREAFVNETPKPSDGTIEIAVVCNDAEMREELDSVGEIYGSREDVRASVTTEFDVTTDQLRERLADDNDVFHFVGHIDGQGFQCPDGVLDAATVEETNATTALLNGCRSHDQGVELVKAGASAAIVSLSDLFNAGAAEVGKTLAQLLHHGFAVGSAMKIIRDYTTIGNRYVVLGDPGVVIAENDRLFPTLHEVRERNDGENSVTREPIVYPVREYGLGSIHKPLLFEYRQYQIAVGTAESITIPLDKLQELIVGPPEPFIVDGELVWSDTWFGQA